MPIPYISLARLIIFSQNGNGFSYDGYHIDIDNCKSAPQTLREIHEIKEMSEIIPRPTDMQKGK